MVGWEVLCCGETAGAWDEQQHCLGSCFLHVWLLAVPAATAVLLILGSLLYFAARRGQDEDPCQVSTLWPASSLASGLFVVLAAVASLLLDHGGCRVYRDVAAWLQLSQALATCALFGYCCVVRKLWCPSALVATLLCALWTWLAVWLALSPFATAPQWSPHGAVRVIVTLCGGCCQLFQVGVCGQWCVKGWVQREEYDSFLALTQPLMHRQESDTPYHPKQLSAGMLSSLSFRWVTPLMSRGARHQLKAEDMFVLDTHTEPAGCRDRLWTHWQMGMPEGSLVRCLISTYGSRYLLLGVVKLLCDALNFSGPVILNLLVRYMTSDKKNAPPPTLPLPYSSSVAYGLMCAALMAASSVAKALLGAAYNWHRGRMAKEMETALNGVIFKKVLSINEASLAEFSSGSVHTLMSVDTSRVVNLIISLHDLWSLPLQIGWALFLLYTQVDYAFLAGLLVVLLLIPINRWLALRIQAASDSMMGAKDARIKIMTEILRGIKSIKVAAWEPLFIKKVHAVRQKELHALAVRKYLDALCVFFWAATSLLFSLFTFGLYTLLGNTLTADIVFTSLALFNVLIAPLNSFPWVSNGIVEAMVSVERMQKFMRAPEGATRGEPTTPWPHTPSAKPQGEGNGQGEAVANELASHKTVEVMVERWSGAPPNGNAGDGVHKEAADEKESVVVVAGDVHGGVEALVAEDVVEEGGAAHEAAALLVSGLSVRLNKAAAVTPFGGVTSHDAPMVSAFKGAANDGGEETGGGNDAAHTPDSGGLIEGGGWVHTPEGLPSAVTFRDWGRTGSMRDTSPSVSSLTQALLQETAAYNSQSGLMSSPQAVSVEICPASVIREEAVDIDGFVDSKDSKVGTALSPGHSIRLQAASFDWSSRVVAATAATLHDVSLAIPEASLAVVTGEVGSGKSSLLAAILGEMWRVSGDVEVRGSVAYVSQHAWIMAGTVRENVLFGLPFNETWYNLVMEATALTMDVEEWSKGDETVVGSRGTSLSGGQRMRLALARALYQDCDVYVLDDIFCALDSSVCQWVLEHAVLGLLGGKTRVIVTHYASCVAAADLMVHMVGGSVVYCGPPRGGLATISEDNGGDGGVGSTGAASVASPKQGDDASLDKDDNVKKDEDGEEEREVGHVKAGVWLQYFSAVGALMVALIAVSLALMQASRNAHDLWLSYWVSHVNPPKAIPIMATATSTHHPHWTMHSLHTPTIWGSGIGAHHANARGVMWYLKILLYITLANSFFTLVRAFSFARGGLRAAQEMHDKLLSAVMAAPMSFFETTPTGRILNRFSSDSSIVDDSLPFILNILLANIVGMMGILATLCWAQPIMLLLLVPLAVVYRQIQMYFRQTSRELRRLESVARSPLYSTFSEVMEGGAVIRAFNKQADMCSLNISQLAQLQRASLTAVAASQWLALRLELIACSAVTAIALLAVANKEGWLGVRNTKHNAGLLGLSLAYALPITGLLNGLLTSSAETEQEMVAVERLLQYIHIEPQADVLVNEWSNKGGGSRDSSVGRVSRSSSFSFDPPTSACSHEGEVVFQEVWLQYPATHTWALQGISFKAAAGQKVAVCGRTGAGKSSILAALSRLTDISRGSIYVSGTNIGSIPLGVLRKTVAVVTQTPLLFSGSIRDNLDPHGRYSDQQMIILLKKIQMWDVLSALFLSQLKGSKQGQVAIPIPASPVGVKIPTPASFGPSPITMSKSPNTPRLSGTPKYSSSMGRPPLSPPTANMVNRMKMEEKSKGGKPPVRPKEGPVVPSSSAVSDGTSRSRSADQSLKECAGFESGSASGPSFPSSSISLEPTAVGGKAPSKMLTPVSGLSSQLRRKVAGGQAAATGEGGVKAPAQGGSAAGKTEAAPKSPRRSRYDLDFDGPQASEYTASLISGVRSESLITNPQLLSIRLGEDGAGLSQGQRQLLVIARMLLTQPYIVVLDECTANIDPYTAQWIQQVLHSELRSSTVIQIAHRLSSILHYDNVLVMDKGKIVETGSPQVLSDNTASKFSDMLKLWS